MKSRSFLFTVTLLEGALAGVAILLCMLVSIDLTTVLPWNLKSLIGGIVATIPLVIGLLIVVSLPLRPFRRICELMDRSIVPLLTRSRWYELPFMAVLAGVGEELMFRGFGQIWLTSLIGPLAALGVVNLIFGLAHAVTITYFIMATIAGLYFSLLTQLTEDYNLTIPIITHALYDYIAFLVLIHRSKSVHKATLADE